MAQPLAMSKRFVLLAVCAVCALLAVTLVGCGGSLKESDVVGTYKISAMKTNGAALTEEQIVELNGKDFELIMTADHYYAVGASGVTRFYGSWELENGKVHMTNNDENITGTWEKSVLTFTSVSTEFSFTKDSNEAELPQALRQQLGVSDK